MKKKTKNNQKLPVQNIGSQPKNPHILLKKFLISLAATVLGIMITFGTNRIYERKKKEAAAEALVDRCLSDMEGRLKTIENVINRYEKHDSLYALVENNPMESLDDEMLGSLIYEFTTASNLLVNHAYEKSFSQSVTSHDILGQYAEVIGEGFEYILYAEENHAQINELQVELLRRQMLARNTFWDKGSVKEVVAETLADPYFKFYQDQYRVHSSAVRHMYYVLSTFIPDARRLWRKEITLEEFRQTTRNNWQEWNNQTN